MLRIEFISISGTKISNLYLYIDLKEKDIFVSKNGSELKSAGELQKISLNEVPTEATVKKTEPLDQGDIDVDVDVDTENSPKELNDKKLRKRIGSRTYSFGKVSYSENLIITFGAKRSRLIANSEQCTFASWRVDNGVVYLMNDKRQVLRRAILNEDETLTIYPPKPVSSLGKAIRTAKLVKK